MSSFSTYSPIRLEYDVTEQAVSHGISSRDLLAARHITSTVEAYTAPYKARRDWRMVEIFQHALLLAEHEFADTAHMNVPSPGLHLLYDDYTFEPETSTDDIGIDCVKIWCWYAKEVKPNIYAVMETVRFDKMTPADATSHLATLLEHRIEKTVIKDAIATRLSGVPVDDILI